MAKMISGKNDIATLNPELALEWDYEKNSPLRPNEFSLYSHKKVWWRCKQGHAWEAIIKSRGCGNGCPYCSGKRVIVGETDLATLNPELASEWDYEGNVPLTPRDVSPNSNKVVWWKCKEGHVWKSIIGNRNKGNGCPYCSGRKPVIGKTDLDTLNPELASEWDYERNATLTPKDVSPHSNKVVWWKCKEGHVWKSMVSNRNKGHGCPYCSGLKPIIGKTDLATLNPELASEWNYDKNDDLKPENFTEKSGKSVYWKCKRCGYEWKAVIGSRKERGCPRCSKFIKSSLPEYAVYFYFKKITEAKWGEKIDGWEVDVFLPAYNIGIEYDGMQWHKDSFEERERRKEDALKSKGIFLIRIKEASENLTKGNIIYYDRDAKYSHIDYALKSVIEIVSKHIGQTLQFSSSFSDDYHQIRNEFYKHAFLKKNFTYEYPEIAKEWDYEKNYPIKPEVFSSHSGESVWWKCPTCKQSYDMTVQNRVNGCACPYCSGHRVLEGLNDLFSTLPVLMEDWDYEKNTGLDPKRILNSSTKNVFWKCHICGGKWKAAVRDRKSGNGCPYCSGKKILVGFNDIATTEPEVLIDWDYDKNIDITPQTVTRQSPKKVWWRCHVCGGEWKAAIYNKVNRKSCPYCTGHKVLKGFNDLETVCPDIAIDWDYEKNGELYPCNVTRGTSKRVWWKCHICGYEMETSVLYRVKVNGCSKCK